MAVRDETLDRKTGEIVARVKAGEAVYMYRSLYLPVDSTVSGDGLNLNLPSSFNLGPLPNLGCDGWDVVTAIPRTLGLGLTNMSLGSAVGSTWGAGIGGIVVGVHLVLRRSFSLASRLMVRSTSTGSTSMLAWRTHSITPSSRRTE
jgi:hypothetical protein